MTACSEAHQKTLLLQNSPGTDLKFLLSDRLGPVVVKSASGKGVFGNGREKLLREAQFYELLPPQARDLFAEILARDVQDEVVSIVMPFYFNGVDLEMALHMQSIPIDRLYALIRWVMLRLRDDLYIPTQARDDHACREWAYVYADSRIRVRVEDLLARPCFTQDEVLADEIRLGGELLDALKGTEVFEKFAQTTCLCLTAGDLAPPNILVDGGTMEDAVLIDPTPFPFTTDFLSDPAEDILRLFTCIECIALGVQLRLPQSHSGYEGHASQGTDVALHASAVAQENAQIVLFMLRKDNLISACLAPFYRCPELLRARMKVHRALLFGGVALRRFCEGNCEVAGPLWDRYIKGVSALLSLA